MFESVRWCGAADSGRNTSGVGICVNKARAQTRAQTHEPGGGCYWSAFASIASIAAATSAAPATPRGSLPFGQ
jgi:hypothetical protein